ANDRATSSCAFAAGRDRSGGPGGGGAAALAIVSSPSAGVIEISLMIGPGFCASLPPREPIELKPIMYSMPLGTASDSRIVPGAVGRTARQNSPAPEIVQPSLFT